MKTPQEEIEIKTMSDIFDTVNDENIERFCRDLVLFIYYTNDIKNKYEVAKIESMLWTDDGVNVITGIVANGNRIEFKPKTK